MSNTERTGEITGKISANPLVARRRRHKTELKHLTAPLAQTEACHKSQVDELTEHLAKTEAHHKAQVEELSTRYTSEIEHLRERIVQMNELLRERSVSLAESEALGEDLRNRLRQQLKATLRLSRLLDEADHAAARLRSSARWQIANPIAALKAKLSPLKSRHLLGYGHLKKSSRPTKSGEPPIQRLQRLMTKSRR